MADKVQKNVAPVAMNPAFAQQQYTNGYTSMVQLSDYMSSAFDGMTPIDSGMGLASCMSMDTSVFNPSFSGLGGMNFGFGMYGSEAEYNRRKNMTYPELMKDNLDQQVELEKAKMKHSAALTKNERAETYRTNAIENKINRAIGQLAENVTENNQSKIFDSYKEAWIAVKEKLEDSGIAVNSEAQDGQIRAEVETLYAAKIKAVTGRDTTLITDIKEYGDSSLTRGVKEGLGFGLGGTLLGGFGKDEYGVSKSKSAEDNISLITQESTSSTSEPSKLVGRVLGGIATVFAAAVALPLAWKGGKRGLGLMKDAYKWAFFGAPKVAKAQQAA